ncbi:ExeM/NucH family extracellular endonuclease [Dyadobacter tibetensis]|uniref:ExeM/NucH family extracellular endonuclease n=1 Tax=Dyadobacter tibetensis TaxID=1211851 RepID=UPI000471B222|nr:ExeM/NucH family extracellular endonuclease [Dyadobacter tibetensis]
MRHFLSVLLRDTFPVLLFLIGFSCPGFSQTQPLPQVLPFIFNGQSANTPPTGMAIHRFGTTSGAIPTSRTLAEGNDDLPYNAGSTSGGWLNAGTNGVDGIGLLASGSNAAGAIVIGINTTGKQDITVSWLCRTVTNASSRDNSVALQYRVGNSGNFINVGTSSVYTSAGKSVGDASGVFSEVLPSSANDKAEVQVRWIYWESSEGLTGSRDRIAVDEISINGQSTGPDITGPEIATLTPAANATNVSITTDLKVVFSEPINKGGNGNITLYKPSNSSSQVIPINDASVVLSGSQLTISGVTLDYAETYYVLIDEGAVEDMAGNYFAGVQDDTTWRFTTINDPGIPTLISSIQGQGSQATGGTFTIEGIVTGVFADWSPAGFYVQEEDTDSDNDPLTSEAIFVVEASPSVGVGQKVKVAGDVSESSAAPSYEQAVLQPTSISILASNQPLPTPVSFSLPALSSTYLERFEGMLVTYPGTLTVSDNYELGSYGSIKLSEGGLVYQPTQILDPNDATASGTSSSGTSNLAAINQLKEDNALRTIVLDDGRAIAPISLPYVNADHTLRVGSTVSGITAIMGYGYQAYRLQPLPAGHTYATATNFSYAPRPGSVPSVGSATVKVASFNVLNYFNGDGLGGGFPTARGASTLVEFERQRAKIISALSEINADVVGLLEIENDGNGANAALSDLVRGLNDRMGPDTYRFITETVTGTDQIRCAIIYKPTKVLPVGSAMGSTNPVFDRPPLAQNFQIVLPSARIAAPIQFNYIVNHFKSKGCGSATGANADQNDGQGCYNGRRKDQANELLNFISTVKSSSGNDYVISMGDYNAYYQEDPMDVLRAGGQVVLANATDYSYLFDGQLGSLDHAVVSSQLNTLVSGVAKWNINSVEPDYLSYKDEVNSGGSDRVNPWSATYTSDAFRSSDHDAVIVGLDFSVALPVSLVSFQLKNETNQVQVIWETASEVNNDYFIVEKSLDASHFKEIARIDGAGGSSPKNLYQYTDVYPSEGLSYYRLVQVDRDGTKTIYRLQVIKREGGSLSSGVYPNPVQSEFNLLNKEIIGTSSYEYRLVSSEGKLIISGSGFVKEIETAINGRLNGLETGAYLIQLVNDSKVLNLKFVKN